MMKKRLAIAALVLVPLAASGQVPVRGIGSPGNANGIAVSGRGVVRVPVKTLLFMAQARGPADERSVLAAMRGAGVDDPVIGAAGPYLNLSNSSTVVRGTIRDVSQAKLDKIGLAAGEYVRAHPGTTVDNIQFSARIDNCAAVEQTARVAALADARRKAVAIAAASGVMLEAITAVGESGGCPLENEQSNFNNGPGQLDLATLTTTVTVFESVTYAITAGDGGRRRPL